MGSRILLGLLPIRKSRSCNRTGYYSGNFAHPRRELARRTDPKEEIMARIEGIDPRQAPFAMRQVFKKVRKVLGRDLTPQKIAARVPRVFWVNALMEWLLGQKAAVPQRLRMLTTLRTAVRVGCPF
jgi:hypothetical protein